MSSWQAVAHHRAWPGNLATWFGGCMVRWKMLMANAAVPFRGGSDERYGITYTAAGCEFTGAARRRHRACIAYA